MNKRLKIILIVILGVIGLIVIDTLQALLLKGNPILSFKVELEDDDSYAYKGIFMDTYYCVKEEDIVSVNRYLKFSKFTCPIDNDEMEELEKYLNTVNDGSMSIKEGTLTNSGLTLIITNLSNDEIILGEEYSIDKKENGKWKPLTPIIDNYGFNAIGYILKPNNNFESNIDWKGLYGELESGEYRLIKNVNDKYVSVEFKIG
mgnify:FL=1